MVKQVNRWYLYWVGIEIGILVQIKIIQPILMAKEAPNGALIYFFGFSINTKLLRSLLGKGRFEPVIS